MRRDGHVGIGMAVYAPIALVLSYLGLLEALAFGLAATAFLSAAPDVDLRLPLVSHRGITHTFLAAIAAGVVTAALGLALTGADPGGLVSSPGATIPAASFGFVVGTLGVVAHLAGDVLTPMGIRPYYPFSSRSYSLDLVAARNRVANKAFSILGAVVLIAAIAGGTWLRTGHLGG